MKEKNIYIIGAGQLGSRHLQALKNVKTRLDITVIDRSQLALKTAKERYLATSGTYNKHSVRYLSSQDNIGEDIDIAIIATNSDVRSKVITELLTKKRVKYLILEKLLFQKKSDYSKIGRLLKSKNVKAWVNCSMRNMPFYHSLKDKFKGEPLVYLASGSQYGLVTNSIHYLDYIAYLTGCYEFEVVTAGLDKKPIASKRKGFLELNGTLEVRFNEGTTASFTCFAKGDAPIQAVISSNKFNCISRETQSKAWLSSPINNWNVEEIDSKIPYQSQATTWLVEDILITGDCKLVSYQDSVKVHLPLLEALRKFLNQNTNEKYNHYPFT